MDKSKKLQERAFKVMPLGVNSNSRYWGKGRTPYFKKGKGAYIWDVDDNKYIDYRLGFGPIILGYAYEEVDNQVIQALREGFGSGITSEIEISVAEMIIKMCPAVEMVRIVNSGSEATMHALRVARAFTGKDKIIKIEGGYHGSYDYMLYSTYATPADYGNFRNPIAIPASSGIPKLLNDLVIPFNNIESLDIALSRYGHEVAAIITEPMLGNYGGADPQTNFMDTIRKRCDEWGILWILDEVKTGFRIAKGGAQEKYNYRPDITTYAKSLGNGYPVAAYGGKKEIMNIIGDGVTQGGTFAGNGVATVAAKATLSIIDEKNVHEHINRLGTMLQDGLSNIFDEAGIPHTISSIPSIFSFSLGISDNKNARDWYKSNQDMYKKIALKVFENGILIDEDPREPICISYSHTELDIEKTIDIFKKVVRCL